MKKITKTYSKWWYDSQDDYQDEHPHEEHGWEDEEGVVYDEDGDWNTSVDWAIGVLRYDGACEPSCWPKWSTGTWYHTEAEQDYRTGEYVEYHYHLDGFTDAEQEEIYKGVTGK